MAKKKNVTKANVNELEKLILRVGKKGLIKLEDIKELDLLLRRTRKLKGEFNGKS